MSDNAPDTAQVPDRYRWSGSLKGFDCGVFVKAVLPDPENPEAAP